MMRKIGFIMAILSLTTITACTNDEGDEDLDVITPNEEQQTVQINDKKTSEKSISND